MDSSENFENSQEVCWICESPDQTLRDLTVEQNKKLISLTRIQNQDAQVTRRFCRDCIKRLNDSYRFVQQCVDAENRLQICIDQQLVSEETEVILEENSSEYLVKLEDAQKSTEIEEEDGDEQFEGFSDEESMQDNSKDKKFPCMKCNRVFSSMIRLQEHEKMHQGIKNYSCTHCGMKFTASNSLKRHVRNIHLKMKRFVCEQCGHAFADSCKLKSHETTHITEKNFSCAQCPRWFKTAEQLERHTIQHDPVAKASQKRLKFDCSLCNQTLSSASALHAHKMRHSDPAFMCNECGKLFTTKLSLNLHLRSHSDDRPYKCGICLAAFKAEKTLSDHQLIHTQEKPHECDVCKRRFRTLSQMKSHWFLHTGLRPYVCLICNKDFNRPWNLRLHMKTHEGRSKDGDEVIESCESS